MVQKITCPFCGKEIQISTVEGKYPLYYVRCSTCRWLMQDYNRASLVERVTNRPENPQQPTS
jgi:transcription elongation factor Elf1